MQKTSDQGTYSYLAAQWCHIMHDPCSFSFFFLFPLISTPSLILFVVFCWFDNCRYSVASTPPANPVPNVHSREVNALSTKPPTNAARLRASASRKSFCSTRTRSRLLRNRSGSCSRNSAIPSTNSPSCSWKRKGPLMPRPLSWKNFWACCAKTTLLLSVS